MSMTEYTPSDALPAGPIVERNAGGSGPLSPLEAARSLADTRYKEQAELEKQATQPKAPDAAAAAEPVKESPAQAEDAAPPQEETGETKEPEAAAEELPPIAPPKSWTKEEKERFQALPRETQEYLAERESAQERSYHQRQREAAEKAKDLESKTTAAEQLRQQYEQALPLLLQSLQQGQQGEFADIKSMADVERLAREDWPRYVMWDAQQKKIAAVQHEVEAGQRRQAAEKYQEWSNFVKEQDALFSEKAPEMSDPKKAAEIGNAAISMLRDIGFTEQELGDLWTGQRQVSLRDHRVQLLVRDGLRYREAQAAAKRVTAVPKPSVQRPGAAPSKATSQEAEIQSIEKQLETASGLKALRLGQQLVQLKRAAAR